MTTNWAAATQVSGEPTPQVAGTNQSMTVSGLAASTAYYFGLETADEVPNWSAISNSPSGTTSAGSDTTPPATTSNLAAGSPTTTSLTLTWTAPGDDGTTGTATTYDVRYLTSGAVVTTNWASATQATGEPTPHSAGTGESFVVSGLSASTVYYFGLETADEVPNWIAISNSPSGTTSTPDTTAPATTSNLATSSPTSSSITLTWTAPGDDGTTGTATTYDVRYRTGGAVVTTNWAAASQATGEPTPHSAGTGETFVVGGLTASTTYYFGLETADEVPNWSAISNSPSGTTSAASTSADLAQDAHDAQRTGYTDHFPTTPWTYVWSFNGPNSTPGTTDQHLYDAPREARVVTGGSYIYAPAGASGIYALNKANGSQGWHFTTATVNATPAYDSGYLYAGGANGYLYKIDVSSGSSVGSYNAGSAINKSVLLVGTYAYVVTDGGQLHKVNTSNMTAVWGSPYSAGSPAATPPAYSASRSCIIFGTDDLYVHAVNDSNGSQKWHVKPTSRTAGYPYEYKYGWPVVAEQHGVVFIRMNQDANQIWSGPSGGPYPTTNADIRTYLTTNSQWQNLWPLSLDDGSVAFIPAVGPGSTEDYINSAAAPRIGTIPIVKNWSGEEVVYMVWRNGNLQNGGDARWDSHLGEMLLDGTSVSGYNAGDLRFVQFANSYIYISDEQTPLTMAGDTVFHAHWGASESMRITDRNDSLGSWTSQIATTSNYVVGRAQQQSGTPDTGTHWTTAGLTYYNDGRYWNGPGWWVYWNIVDPPGHVAPSAYSAGILPRYTIVTDSLIIVEGNGGDLLVLHHSGS